MTSAHPGPTTGPDLGAPTRILVVRHGVTDHTQGGRVTGRGGDDPELNAEGRRQAEAVAHTVAARLGGDDSPVVVSSGLRRAAQTADAIARQMGISPVQNPDWDEQSAGEWDGLTWSEIARRDAAAPSLIRTDAHFAPPDGESFAQLARRVETAWNLAVQQTVNSDPTSQEPTGAGVSSVVIVTHRGPIDVLLTMLLGIERRTAALFRIAPCSITGVSRWRDGGVAIDTINDTAHLR